MSDIPTSFLKMQIADNLSFKNKKSHFDLIGSRIRSESVNFAFGFHRFLGESP